MVPGGPQLSHASLSKGARAMSIARLLSAVVVMSISLTSFLVVEFTEAQTRVKCGAILDDGKTYVLDRDLTCGQFGDHKESYPGRRGMVMIMDGAILNLNGHVMTCDPNYTGPFAGTTYGIVVRNATVTNGTVRGCTFGIVPSNSLVKGMTVTDNGVGIQLREKFVTGNNFIIGNTIERNVIGVEIQETSGETLIDNIARENSV